VSVNHRRNERILDASLNRAGEALRVLEDYARFVSERPALTADLKQLRHQLGDAAAALAARCDLLGARHAGRDVGRPAEGQTDLPRADATAVIRANARRAEEAFRSLEEYSKVVDVALARQFEAMRFRAYELEQRLLAAAGPRKRLAAARLYVILTASLAQGRGLVEVAEAAIEGGVDVLQLREKQLPDRELLDQAAGLQQVAERHGVLFIVNDRADVAVLSGADGVHLGAGDLTVAEARRILGVDRIVGVSTHSLEQATQAQADGADYIGCGAVFPTRTKDQVVRIELATLGEVCSQVPLPAFAIGGITAANVGEVLSAGATRVAVCTAVIAADDVAAAARSLKAELTGRAISPDIKPGSTEAAG